VCFTTACCTYKALQQCVVQQQTVSTHVTIIWRKLQSLGKCRNENMSKAVSRSQNPSNRGFCTHHFPLSTVPLATDITINSRQNSLFAAVCFILKRRCERYKNQWWTCDVVQQLATMPIHASNCCTNCQTTPHTIKLFAQKPVLRKQFDRVWGP
jgi:hypothetical protein